MARDLKAELEQLRELAADGGLACPKCAYDLTGMSSNWCPECGKLLRPTMFTERGSDSFRLDLHSRLLMLVLLSALLLAWPIAGAWVPVPSYAFTAGGSIGPLGRSSRRIVFLLGSLLWYANAILPMIVQSSKWKDIEFDVWLLRGAEWAGWVFVAIQYIGLVYTLLV